MHTKTVAETKRVTERKRARVERGAGDVTMADRQGVASGEDESQDENRIRDIHIGKRGQETANEEQPDKLRKTARFELDAPSTSSSSSVRAAADTGSDGGVWVWSEVVASLPLLNSRPPSPLPNWKLVLGLGLPLPPPPSQREKKTKNDKNEENKK